MTKVILALSLFIFAVSCGAQENESSQSNVSYQLENTLRYQDVLVQVQEAAEDSSLKRIVFSRTEDPTAEQSFTIRSSSGTARHTMSAVGDIIFFLDRGTDLYVFDVRDFSHRVVSIPTDSGADFLAAITEQDVALIERPAPTTLFNIDTGQFRQFQNISFVYRSGDIIVVDDGGEVHYAFWPEEEVNLEDLAVLEEVSYPAFGNLQIIK